MRKEDLPAPPAARGGRSHRGGVSLLELQTSRAESLQCSSPIHMIKTNEGTVVSEPGLRRNLLDPLILV
ncbi:hypothetical protein VULLAG_LOCUS16432 [Vulpes lagopus]